MMKFFAIWFIAVAFMISFPTAGKSFSPPTVLLSEAEMPKLFIDDMEFADLDLAIDRQLEAYKKNPLKDTIKMGESVYPQEILKTSLEKLKVLLSEYRLCSTTSTLDLCREVFSTALKSGFYIYRPEYVETHGQAKFTGYHSPIIKVSKVKTAEFPYGIYTLPEPKLRKKFSRNEILFDHKLEDQGLALFYMQDAFELYLLHIEGGGVAELPTGERIFLSYAGDNSQRMEFVSKYMLAQKYIESPSLLAQRTYLKSNPDKAREIFATCPNFIYFQISETPPVGMESIPLTDNRSIAQDRKIYPRKGLISFITTQRPVKTEGSTEISKVPLNRFFIDQDTGGAIKGSARADIYFGISDEAQFAAEQMHELGSILYFIAK